MKNGEIRMDVNQILDNVKQSYPAIEFEELGIDGYSVHTGHTYSDGDELHIVLKKHESSWIFTDEGHTAMQLSYENQDIDGFKISESANKVVLREGRIVSEIQDEESADVALNSIIQSMLQAIDS